MSSVSIPGVRIEKQIGRGATGTVWKGRQLSMDRPVAVKILSAEKAQDKDYVERFVHQAQSLAKLSHPNVLGAIDAGITGGHAYFVMEYVEGIPLSDHLKQHPRLPEKEALEIILGCARALEHAHENGVIHRNVKPKTILLTASGEVKLRDFGMVQRTGGKKIVGTPEYLSPEAVRGRELDIRSDIYSLGATFYRLVTGAPPFTSDNVMDVMVRQASEAPVPPKRHTPGLSDNVQRIILRMLAKSPDQRYATPTELIAALQVDPERRRKSVVPNAEERKPSSTLVLAAVLGGVLLLIGGVMLVSGSGDDPVQPEPPTAAHEEPEPEVEPEPVLEPEPVKAPAPDPVDTAEAQFNSQLETILDRAEYLWEKQSPTRLSGPYGRLAEEARDRRGSEFEARWVLEIGRFIQAQEERIDPIWARVRDEAELYEKTGELDRAMAALRKFPEELRYFKRHEPDRLDTRAGTEYEEIETRLTRQIAEKSKADREALHAAQKSRDFRTAWALLETLKGEDLGEIRLQLVQGEYESMMRPPLDTAKIDAVQARMQEIASANEAHPAVSTRARELGDKAPKQLADAATDALIEASKIFDAEIRPAVEAALVARDTVKARRVISQLLFGRKYAAVQTALRVDGVDFDAIRTGLQAPLIQDAGALVQRLESAMILISDRIELAALQDTLHHARSAVLLEDLYRRALTGLEKSAKNRKILKAAKTELIQKQSRLRLTKLEPAPGRTVAVKIKEETLHISPLGNITMHFEDVITFALLTAGEAGPEQYLHLAAALHAVNAGDYRNAYKHLAEVSEPGPSMGLDPLRTRVGEEFAKLPPEEEEPEPDGKKKKKKKKYPFAGKVKELSRGLIQVTYDFSDAAQLDDFVSNEWGGESLTIEHIRKGQVSIKGSGLWNWKALLEGDVYIEFNFTARGESVGTVMHNEGTDRGYASFFDYNTANRGGQGQGQGGQGQGGRGGRGGGGRGGWGNWMNFLNDQLFIIKLPFDMRNFRNGSLASKGNAGIKQNQRYTIWSRRQGDKVEAGSGGVRAQGNDDEMHEGRSGLWMSNSELILHSVKIQAKVQDGWLEQNAE